MFFNIGTNIKIVDILRPILEEDIVLRPHIYHWSTDALQIYIEHHLKTRQLKEARTKISTWRCWDVVKMIKYIGFKYNSEYFINQIALKPLEFLPSKVIILYLCEIF